MNRVFALLTACVLAIALLGCGGSKNKETPQDREAARAAAGGGRGGAPTADGPGAPGGGEASGYAAEGREGEGGP